MILFFTNYLLLVRVFSIYEWLVMLFLAGLFILAKQPRRGLVYLSVFSLLFAFEHLLMPLVSGEALSFLSMLAIGGRLMLPCFMAGSYLYHTTSVHAFIHGLRRWHMPEKLLLTLAVMLRFLPTIRQDYQTIKRSLLLRGIFVSIGDILKRPVTYFEYLLIPLLMSASRTAQDLTVATLTKSVGATGAKTCYKNYRFRQADFMVLGAMAVLFILISMGVTI